MHCRPRPESLASLLLILLMLSVGGRAEDAPSVLIVDLYINGEYAAETFVLRDESGQFFVEEAVLSSRQIERPWPDPVAAAGGRYYGLRQLPGTHARLDELRMALHVDFPAGLMPAQAIELAPRGERPWSDGAGVYVDYDLNLIRQERTRSTSFVGLFRPVFFGGFGNLRANTLYRSTAGSSLFPENADQSGLKVLELALTRDDPDNLRSLRIGDVFAPGGFQGRALRIGGIQLATNFATRPEFISNPLPSFYGEATVPTALDIYVNGRLAQRQETQPGPYLLEDIPAVNGDGQIQVVARDALGREQIYTQDFYMATELLREGLSEYSLNVGAVREDYGLENFRYGEIIGTAIWRHGVRDDLTVGGHGEFTDGLFMAGGSMQYAIEAGGTLSAGLGLSGGGDGGGARWQFGYRLQGGDVNYNIDLRGSSRGFRVAARDASLPSNEAVFGVGRNFYERGYLGMSLLHQGFRQQPDRTILSANYTKAFRSRLTFSARVSYLDAEEDDLLVGLRLSMPFGRNQNAAVGIRSSDSGEQLEAEFSRSLPYGPGYGYRVGMGLMDSDYIDAGLAAHGDYGLYRLDIRDSDIAGTVWEAGTSGSFAYLDGAADFTREVRDGFAVVNVGNFEGVRVYAENLEVGRTDENGRLFVTGLRPYLENTLRIEADDLPLTARIRDIEAEAVPYASSGVIVNFDVQRADNVILRAVLPGGRPVPEGAYAIVGDAEERFPVGLDGKLFLQSVEPSSSVSLRWGEKACYLKIPEFDSAGFIARLGEVTCRPDQESAR